MQMDTQIRISTWIFAHYPHHSAFAASSWPSLIRTSVFFHGGSSLTQLASCHTDVLLVHSHPAKSYVDFRCFLLKRFTKKMKSGDPWLNHRTVLFLKVTFKRWPAPIISVTLIGLCDSCTSAGVGFYHRQHRQSGSVDDIWESQLRSVDDICESEPFCRTPHHTDARHQCKEGGGSGRVIVKTMCRRHSCSAVQNWQSGKDLSF